jgi:hypothetical protein
MPVRSGRLEKRIQLEFPVQISSLRDPSATECATSENVCSLGVRICTRRAWELNERLYVKPLDGDVPMLARVIYCQRLADERFGIGLQFQRVAVNWPRGSMAGTAD